MKVRTIIRYSEAFKLEVVNKYAEGCMSQSEICKHYDIRGSATLNHWLRKYGKESLLNRIIRVEKHDEKSKLKNLEKENQKLKNALAEAHMRQITHESFLQVASEMMGISIAELKKKLGAE